MPSSDLYDDGEHGIAFQHGPTLPSSRIETRSLLYRETWRIDAGAWKALPIASRGPGGSYLIEESEPAHLGCALLEWDRLFAEVPRKRVTYQKRRHAYQFLTFDGIATADLAVTARITKTYRFTLAPESIALAEAYRLVSLGGGDLSFVKHTGTAPSGSWMIAEDDSLDPWPQEGSPIYCHTRIEVPIKELTSL